MDGSKYSNPDDDNEDSTEIILFISSVIFILNLELISGLIYSWNGNIRREIRVIS